MLPQASTYAAQVDSIFAFIVIVSVIFLVGITIAMIYFAIRYNRKRYTTPKDIEGNLFLEVLWTVIPTILVMMMFWYGWQGFRNMREVSKDAMIVKVTGEMWAWRFAYPNGKQSEELYVPVNKPVKTELASKDVLHSFFIPAFRVKEDAVPGKENYATFTPTEIGVYDIECAEYCGMKHSQMLSKVHVVSDADFNAWLNKNDDADLPRGLVLMKQHGCTSCHATQDKTRIVGPSLRGIFGTTETEVINGVETQIVVDEAHLRESILEPTAAVVKGFPAIMPPQKGRLTEDEITAIIDYIKTLK